MRERIVEEIRRLANANGSAPGLGTFEAATGIGRAQWYGIYWARWGDALVEAGFPPNEMRGKSDIDFLLQKVAEAYRHYGRIATAGELQLYRKNNPNFPWRQTLDKRFGSKAALLLALSQWVAARDDYSDIVTMLPVGSIGSIEPKRKRQADGSVYLIQSGPHYKIGRSDELERRVKEIRVALPDAATLVHTITTDDPPGIEAYWHRRFADKRANGEWFKLTISDVRAFKRRKFQ